jgi:hypothetical protein
MPDGNFNVVAKTTKIQKRTTTGKNEPFTFLWDLILVLLGLNK